MIENAIKYFCDLHDIECNQKYTKNLPYSFHLKMVDKQACLFRSCLEDQSDACFDTIRIGCYGHDSIEDARLTYNDIKIRFGKDIAEIIQLCTEDRGRTREERHSDNYYRNLVQNPLATYVKLCDIIANTKFGFLENSTQLERTIKEYPKIQLGLYRPEYKIMFEYLENIFKVQQVII